MLRKPQLFTSSPYSGVLIIKVLSKFQTFLSGNPGSKIESNLKGKVSNGHPRCTSIWSAKSKKTQIYIYVISNVIIYHLFIILFHVFLLCSLILSFCNTVFNLFFTLSLCNIYFYFVIRYYRYVFDIFKMLSLFLLCVFILSLCYYPLKVIIT